MKKLFAILLLALSVGVQAKETIKLILPIAPGGFADTISRKLQKHIMENNPDIEMVLIFRPGGDTIVALNEFLNDTSKHVWYWNSESIVYKAAETEQLTQTIKKIVPVAPITVFGSVISSGKNSSIKTWQDLINESKRRPVTVGVSNVTQKMMAQDLFGKNPNVTIVPYPGENPNVMGMLNGSLDAIILTKGTYISVAPQYGFNGLVVTGDTAMNGIPPLSQFGYHDVEAAEVWVGIFAKPGTSTEDVQYYNKLLAAALKDQDLIDHYKSKEFAMPKNTSAKAFDKMFNNSLKKAIK